MNDASPLRCFQGADSRDRFPQRTLAVGRPKARSGAAFTLLELLIVLAILVAVLALGWPALRRTEEKRQLRIAARQLQGVLLRTRLDAMQTGCVHVFHFRPASAEFKARLAGSPLGGAAGSLPAAESSGDVSPFGFAPLEEAPVAGAGSMSENGEGLELQTLPGPVRFADSDADPTVDPFTDASSSAASLDGLGGAPPWSPAVWFYPNGRTSNARIPLTTLRFAVALKLRGLTGRVTVGEVQRREPRDTTTPEVAVP